MENQKWKIEWKATLLSILLILQENQVGAAAELKLSPLLVFRRVAELASGQASHAQSGICANDFTSNGQAPLPNPRP